ncbi:MAG TPA: 1-deoxy-D-xylulose-5-phosphate reductoisomerase [Candidatus Omnitrophota bacterium]|nr:1-deoxy-D-xylulose-5-phosphate reductoisomerase [Candidatus Omnitrophota bacterium]HPD85008.1 1-deoxy-D-xylulose-5-phosphate reductoisomerase [Candidatus Omnitrophota bacterium]HRZ03866.1 1-deoxy-D-xylulose-5-phosphate reductoisomerase [Candidatus Omnitrophota bacterium]
MHLKRIAVLGSTGSIGINTLRVVERFPKEFQVVALSAYTNTRLLEQQIKKFSPLYAGASRQGIEYLHKCRGLGKSKLFCVEEGMAPIVNSPQVDTVVLGIRGAAALKPLLGAVRSGKTVALANKEALVMAGHIIIKEAKRHNATIVPVDSEQSAIFQCLDGKNKSELNKVYLTASGGSLCDVPKSEFGKLSVSRILKHPRWKMGKKITVDSATLMNKGLEIIEAMWLFNLDADAIEVLIHPQAVIHSMVEFRDGSILAQLGITDMRLPIQYALTYPRRFKTNLKDMDFLKLRQLTFKKPDLNKFPALQLCMDVARDKGTTPCVLNAANEEAVEAFLNNKVNFLGIYKIVEKVVSKHRSIQSPTLEDVWAADGWAREQAKGLILN